MHITYFRCFAATLVLALGACAGDPKAPNEANFTSAINADLGQKKDGNGLECLRAIPTYPYAVSERDGSSAAEIKRQDEYVRIGLTTERTVYQTSPGQSVVPSTRHALHQYTLTSTGRDSYITRHSAFDGNVLTFNSFCYASYRVGKIINFSEPADFLGIHVSQVRWLPTVVAVSEWAKDDKVPAITAEVQQTLADLQSKEQTSTVELTNTGWKIASIDQ